MKYLVLNFGGAKLFVGRKTNDIITDYTLESGKRKRETSFSFKEPLTVYQISNVLHVLFGERPKASLRNVMAIQSDEYIFDKAKNSYLRIDAFKKFDKKKNEFEYVKEKTRLKKAVFDSYSPSVYLNWNVIERYLGRDLFFDFIKQAENILGFDPMKKTFMDFILIVQGRLDDFYSVFEYLKKQRKSGLVSVLRTNDKKVYGSVTNNYFNQSALMVVSGIDDAVILSGQIVVPVTNEDLERISAFRGTCTILDGGLVWIDHVASETDLTEEYMKDFTLVGDISTEKHFNKQTQENEA